MAIDTPASFAIKMRRFAGDIGNVERDVLNRASLTVKKSVGIQLLAAGVKDGRLRGVGKKGARIGVRYTIGTGTGLERMSALVAMTGPAHLLERDTKAHRIPRERGRRARKRYVVIPGVGVRAWANHPGTKGKHPWAKGVHAARPAIGRIHQKVVHDAMVKVFR